mmetsp:Transcript_9832/g.28984  ORF Transcript_9832/g.28984 Transcript_9832/m.28984 type:complete len:243 (+) Transcript_9832:94-822(+)
MSARIAEYTASSSRARSSPARSPSADACAARSRAACLLDFPAIKAAAPAMSPRFKAASTARSRRTASSSKGISSSSTGASFPAAFMTRGRGNRNLRLLNSSASTSTLSLPCVPSASYSSADLIVSGASASTASAIRGSKLSTTCNRIFKGATLVLRSRPKRAVLEKTSSKERSVKTSTLAANASPTASSAKHSTISGAEPLRGCSRKAPARSVRSSSGHASSSSALVTSQSSISPMASKNKE